VPGKAVSAGDVLLTLEAMKMEMLIPAPREGLVREIRVKAGEQVGAGQVLAVLEAGEKKAASGGAGAGRGAGGGSGGRARGEKKICFRDFCGGGDRDEWQRLSSDFYSVFAGFDTPAEARLCFDRLADFVLGHLEFAPAFRGLIVRAIEFFVAIESVFALRRGQEDGFGRFGAQAQELVAHYFRRSVNREKGLPESFTRAVDRVFALYNVKADGPVDILRRVFFHIFRSRANGGLKQHLLLAAFSALENFPAGGEASAKSVAASAEHSRVRGESARLEGLLDELARLTQAQMPSLADAAINARYRLFDREKLEDIEEKKRARVKRLLDLALRARAQGRQASEFFERLQDLGDSSTAEFVSLVLDAEDAKTASLSLEALCLRMNRDRQCGKPEIFSRSGQRLAALSAKGEDGEHESILAVTDEKKIAECMELCAAYCKNRSVEMNLYVRGTDAASFFAGQGKSLKKLPPKTVWACVGFLSGTEVSYRSYAKRGSSWQEDAGRASLSPLAYRELRIFRLSAFDTQLLRSGEGFYLFHIVSPENPKDERLIACVEVSSTRAEFTEDGAIGRMVAFEKTFMDALYALRAEQIQRRNRLHWNRIVIHMRPVLGATINQIQDYASLLAARTLDLGIERLSIYCRLAEQDRGTASFPAHAHGAQEKELLFDNIVGTSFTLDSREPVREPLHAIDGYAAKVVRARQRGTFYPYEVIKMLTSSGASSSEEFFPGEFEEFDLAESPVKAEGSAQPENQNTPKKPKKPDTQDKRAKAAPETWTPEKTYRSVSGRPYGENEGNIVFGIISNRLPDGRNIRRVLIVSDPSYDLCSLTEAECRRVSAALDLAEDLGIPAEFLPVSSGARVDMDSGTENLDWTASTLKRIIEYTQAGRELNIVVAGVNVGAQSYWNAEATMLMHTRGLLIMTEDASMLLTGKKALDFSGSVSSENNVGIGGAMKIMEPNGQAQIRVKNLKEACVLLLRHYSLTYREPGRLWPDRAATTDPTERNAGLFPYKDTLGQGFATIGDIFSAKHNPERKKPFDIRQVMAALTDQDQPRLERWGGMRDAETAVVWEARIAGYSAGLIGIESQALPRQGEVPYDGPETWSGGTLFPLSSKKTARAINAFSGRLPLVLLANLSGFDGSPESLRKLQLEYGAEIGRAVVNFRGPFIFVVIGRYHGGAYVVFSKHLNPNLHSAALEGARASVIGGAPAAAVVFPSLVLKDTHEDPALVKAREKLKTGAGFSQKDYEEVFRKVHAEKQSALAARFDRIHSVERAKKVGSIDAIITIKDLRPYVAAQIEKSLGE
jgi:acetyl-CoA carboxylase carboxyltransferase component/pyruvate/2-oxoglutarate dehydrogenase complex dihydrolipoamide acyltransferase (E2) component